MRQLDDARLAAVYRTGLLNTPAEGRFDRITRVARRLLSVPIATVTLVADDYQFHKSAMGLVGDPCSPIESSFCARAIVEDDVMVIPNASLDARFKDNPLVTGAPFICFYAGKPISFEGQRVGTLCIVDREPRQISPAEVQDLCDLAQWAESEIHSQERDAAQFDLMTEVDRLREMAMVDNLTRTWNRNGLTEVFNRELALAEREQTPLSLIMCDIDHFKSVNDTLGHDVGDLVLKRVADRIRLSVRPYDAIGRTGGEEFVVLLPRTHGPMAQVVAERIRQAVEAVPIDIDNGQTRPVTLSLGVVDSRCRSGQVPGLSQLTKAADLALYQAKREGRNRVVAHPTI
ncbi:MAG: diguanylate cyclase [Vulcanimicrobiota bacterium]